jgi:hypothetical protein
MLLAVNLPRMKTAMTRVSVYRPSNPFRTANIRPGANAFVFSRDADWLQLLNGLKEQRFCEIVGAHGTGKSTLLHQIITECQTWNWLVLRHVVDASKPVFSWMAINSTHDDKQEVLRTVDGFEQLSRKQRRLVLQHCQRNKERLLITSHHREGLALLHETRVDLAIARRVLETILYRERLSFHVQDELLQRLLQRHRGNLREVLFALFDLFSHDALY